MRRRYKAIIAGIVLFHAIAALLLAAFFLRRRRQRKLEARPYELSPRSANNQQLYRQQYLHYARVGSWPVDGPTAAQTGDHIEEGTSGGTTGRGQGGGT